MLLLDITPLSLGIETAGGLMDVLIPRNTKIPAKASRQYTTQVDGQPGMRISVFQGERDLVKDNRKLAEFNLTQIPGMPAGLPKVEVAFLINADGILTVSAKELRSGVEQQIEVKPQYGLTDDEVEKCSWIRLPMPVRIFNSVPLQKPVPKGNNFLKPPNGSCRKMQTCSRNRNCFKQPPPCRPCNSLTMEDKDLVQRKIEELNEISRPYAERLMDQAVSSAMKGKRRSDHFFLLKQINQSTTARQASEAYKVYLRITRLIGQLNGVFPGR